jgi:hypothetical protein
VSTCPDGHPSSTDDYCDVCGAPMPPAPPPSAPSSALPSPSTPSPGTAVPGAPAPASGEPPPAGGPDTALLGAVPPAPAATCDRCGAERPGRFCESCGHDSALPSPAVPAPAPAAPTTAPAPAAPAGSAPGWTAVATADRGWFEEVRARKGPDAGTVEFPEYCPERRFDLRGQRLTIGRHSRSRGIEPDLDLAGPPLDPGVSAQHAMLVADGTGGWRIVDLDSTNGTVLSGPSGDRPLRPHTPAPLTEHDTVKLGAWTALRLRRP